MRTAVIHQPDFLPYSGFFERLIYADIFIILDHVQFVSHTSASWMHRDKIKTPYGEKWISQSLQKHSSFVPINTIKLSRSVDWRGRNINQIHSAYWKSPFYAEVWPLIEAIYSFESQLMVDFNVNAIRLLLDVLDISVDVVHSSGLLPRGSSNEMLIGLLRQVGASHYLSGDGAKSYLRPELFLNSGIAIRWQNFVHPVYDQLYGSFVPYLSIIDMLFNCGIIASRQLLRQR